MAIFKDAPKPGAAIEKEHYNAEEKGIESNADYSGAVKKSSAEEIALVKKLDRRIMGILWAMYFLVGPQLSMTRN